MSADQDAIAYADFNIGISLATDGSDTRSVDLNVGVVQPESETIRQQAVGWGVTPTRTHTVTRKILVDDVRYADLNVI